MKRDLFFFFFSLKICFSFRNVIDSYALRIDIYVGKALNLICHTFQRRFAFLLLVLDTRKVPFCLNDPCFGTMINCITCTCRDNFSVVVTSKMHVGCVIRRLNPCTTHFSHFPLQVTNKTASGFIFVQYNFTNDTDNGERLI